MTICSATRDNRFFRQSQKKEMDQGGLEGFLYRPPCGSTSVTTNAGGARQGELWYKARGETRGVPYGTTPTDYRYTGQRVESDLNLYWLGFRMYDPRLGRFIQPDTIVPDPKNPQSLNRYAYTLNNPLRYRDPAGHNWEDVVYNVNELTGGFLSEWAYINTAQMAQSLAVQPNESVAATAGRAAADIFGIYQGVEFMAGGVGLMGAGVTACATGVFCPAGAAVLAGGGVLAADGAVVTGFAAVNGGKNLSNLLMMTKKGNQGQSQADHMFGRYGAQFKNKSLWSGDEGMLHAENPNPGQRPGQIHFQEHGQNGHKWYYDPTTGQFLPEKITNIIPPARLKQLLMDKHFQDAIAKGLRFLGELQ